MENVLSGLRDIVYNKLIDLDALKEEDVFRVSLLRSVSLSSIKGQYKRILDGQAVLTKFNFIYKKEQTENDAGIEISFDVEPNSKPPTNIHVLIARNGVGKTTLLNNMVLSIVDINAKKKHVGQFYEDITFYEDKIGRDYFSSITSIAFSAFEDFIPPTERVDRSKGTGYFYVGLKKLKDDITLKGLDELSSDFESSLGHLFGLNSKVELWLEAIKTLQSDGNFSDYNLEKLYEIQEDPNLLQVAKEIFKNMSSGHAVILLTLSRLIETVEEKTLVLIDEPESHLHPPLLSSFMRALSNLLIHRNAVAIIATHSPVVLQEVPKSCVWKLRRNGLDAHAERPEIETFGENVGVLTREIFGLEVTKSGFYQLLENSVAEGKGYNDILEEYNNQLGFEGRAILKSLIYNRDSLVEGENESNF